MDEKQGEEPSLNQDRFTEFGEPGILSSIHLQNIVAFVNLETKLDLHRLVHDLPGYTKYEPERFPALIVKFKDPEVSFRVFQNGKMNATGAKSMADLREGVSKFVDQLESLGIDVAKNPKIKVTNVVATVDLGLDVNFDEIALNVENVEYEPETFPGLVYRHYKSNASILVFANGKMVVTGMEQISEAVHIIREFLEKLIQAGLIDRRQSFF